MWVELKSGHVYTLWVQSGSSYDSQDCYMIVDTYGAGILYFEDFDEDDTVPDSAIDIIPMPNNEHPIIAENNLDRILMWGGISGAVVVGYVGFWWLKRRMK